MTFTKTEKHRKTMGERRARVAVDCEMVGIGFYGKGDMLARVSVVDERGGVLYDTFVAPQEKVVDYRTPVSGVRRQDLIGGTRHRPGTAES